MNRRDFVRNLAVVSAAAPMLAVRELTKPEPPADLPEFEYGSVLTSDTWNALTQRVNALSKSL